MTNHQQTAVSNITDLRREYTASGLRRHQLPDAPMALFEHWLAQAQTAQLPDPSAMCVATTDSRGQAYQRMVLLKEYDQRSMTFYTNLTSRKAQHLASNNRLSLHFPWHGLERQVMVIGYAEKLPEPQVANYFYSRPLASQLGAWASHQSARIASRQELERRYAELSEQYQNGQVPLPTFWGGYRVTIEAMEFWQGGRYRLHDRFIYEKDADCWKISRLAP